MKKRIFSMLIALALSMSVIPSVLAATNVVVKPDAGAQKNYNPYEETIAKECDTAVDNNYANNVGKDFKIEASNGFANCANYRYIKFADMDFGANKAKKVRIKYACNAARNGTIEFLKDPVFKSDGNIGSYTSLAKISGLSKTGSWSAWKQSEWFEVTGDAIGVFDLYVKFSGTAGQSSAAPNFYSFEFEWEYEDINGPTVLSGGEKVTNLSKADSLSAEAEIQKNTEAKEEYTGAIILAEYAENGAMLSLEYDEQLVLDDNEVTPFYIPEYDKNSDTVGLGVYFWKNDLTQVKQGSEIGAVSAGSGEVSTSDISATAMSGTVTISGSGAEDDRLSVVVVPSDYDKNEAAYKSAVQAYEAMVYDGEYLYSFKMNEDVPTGEYIAIVKGENTSLEKAFSYTNPKDIYNELVALKGAQDSTVAGLLKKNAGMLGIDAGLFEDVAKEDATLINAKLKEVFSENPIDPDTSDFTALISTIKTAILPQSVVASIKSSSASKATELIEEYAAELLIKDTDKYKEYFTGDNKTHIGKAVKDSMTAELKAEDFPTTFDSAVIVGVFNAAPSWGYVDSAILDFDDELGISTSNYKKIINRVKSKMCNEFLDSGFKTTAEIISKFNRILPEYATDDNMKESSYELMTSQVGSDIYTIAVSIKKPEVVTEEEAAPTFTDLDSVEWAKDSILSMYSSGFVTGKSEGIFAPHDNITREEFAAILVRSFGIAPQSADGLAFYDVDRNAWYAGYVAAAYNTGIVNGMGDSTFGIGQPITREQAAAMLKRAVSAVGMNILPKKSYVAFIDSIQISDYAYDSVIELAKAGVISGVGSDSFLPRNNATRAEAVVMISRLHTSIR